MSQYATAASHCAPLRRHRTAFEPGVRLGVGRDEPGPRPRLDGHVAHRHPPFHRQIPDRAAGVLDEVASAAAGADPPDDGENQVLAGASGRQRIVHRHPHALGAGRAQRLRREHVLALRRPDPEGEGPERAVGRRVTVAAHQCRPRQGEALLRSDDVDDALARVEHVEDLDSELPAVRAQCLDLEPRLGVRDAEGAVRGRHVVVGDRKRRVRPSHAAPGQAQPLERLRREDLVQQMAVDVENVDAVVLDIDEMAVPDLFEECLRSCHAGPSGGSSWPDRELAPRSVCGCPAPCDPRVVRPASSARSIRLPRTVVRPSGTATAAARVARPRTRRSGPSSAS